MRRPTAAALLFASLTLGGGTDHVRAWDEDGYCALAPSPLMSELDHEGSSENSEGITEDGTTCSVPARATDGTPLFEGPIDRGAAAAALASAKTLASARAFDEALLSLRVVEMFAPELADRWALLRGQWLRAAGHVRDAQAAFSIASASADPATALRGRIGDALAGVENGDRRAEDTITHLIAAHRDLADAAELRFALGKAKLLHREREAAIDTWRALDLDNPGSIGASRARIELEALRASGAQVPGFSLEEQVARLDRWVRSGPLSEARVELERMRLAHANDEATTTRLDEIEAKIVRFEGGLPPAPRSDTPFTVDRDTSSEGTRRAIEARATASQRRGARRPSVSQLVSDLELAARNGWRNECDLILQTLGARHEFDASTRIEAAALASGTASEAVVYAIVAPIAEDPRRGTAARYLQACSLLRSGSEDLARDAFEHVARTDRTELRWYALWSRQHLRALNQANVAPGVVTPPVDAQNSEAPEAEGAKTLPSNEMDRTAAELVHNDAATQTAAQPSIVERARDARSIATLLTLARRHGATYPWLARAARLVELRDYDAAADELHNIWVARHAAKRGSVPSVGLAAVYQRIAGNFTRPDRAQKAALLRLTEAEIEQLADVAEALEDPGLAVDFGGRSRLHGYPLAYETYVRESAARHGIDPELVWAVMRVESVYDRRIVSYAGAIGLLQIMPRTGRLIARSLGHEEFTAADLLDPRISIEFGAWYLRSLIDRFDGRLPLAIAAYNGGPHNVRRWISAHSANVPLDAFMERIPFGQTWRYVRRVMGHYAEYKSRAGQDLPTLQTTLPGSAVDAVGF